MQDDYNDINGNTDNPEIDGDEARKCPIEEPEGEPAASVVDRRHWAAQDAPEEGEGAVPDLKPAYVTELEARLEDAERKLRQTLSAHRSREDELGRVKERLERDREKRLLQSKLGLFQQFLEPLDNLERTIQACRQGGDVEAMVQGVMLVYRHFQDVLTSQGLEKYDPTGEIFDPEWHEAISRVAARKASEHNRIVEVHQVGYRLGDQVLRPARVVVALAG